MKRTALWCMALTLAGAGSLGAQGLTMQMSNGWAFTFTGNVNAFLMYTHGTNDTPGPIDGGLVSTEQGSRIRTGLLPGFANFEASGKEGDLNLKVHFGFAPQINSPGVHDAFGAQIDMREVYLTVGGSWGQILAGRELGLFQRQNILTDMTLFGTGASGGVVDAGGTTLGRIGFGYLYPNFNAQITYSTPADKPAQFAIGLFDPSEVFGNGSNFVGTRLPRLETEFSWSGNLGSSSSGQMSNSNKVMFWVNGLVQHTNECSNDNDCGGTNPSVTSAGVGGGIKFDLSGLSLLGSGYYASGLGSTLMFGQVGNSALDGNNQARKSKGYMGQITYSQPGTKWMIGGSYGESKLDQTTFDQTDGDPAMVESNKAADVLLSFQWTKSLRWVLEYTWARSQAYSGAQNTSNQGASGFMLFF